MWHGEVLVVTTDIDKSGEMVYCNNKDNDDDNDNTTNNKEMQW